VRKAEPELHDEAWLIKYSVNGCVGPSDCAVVSANSPNKQPSQPEVYPNPFSNNLNISFSNEYKIENTEFIVVNVLGEVVARKQLNSTDSDMNLSALPKGVYFWQIVENNVLLGQGKLLKDK
jgi:hypothetical protein